ncbi:hypothetical protein SOVF_197260 [Spinacia oleracea]|nr:hypothetical protein SOVF_197260 [Spinacia oleracea]
MPFSEDHGIVTCTTDGQLNTHKFLKMDVWRPLLLVAMKVELTSWLLNLEVLMHIFYTCGEDGVVQHVRISAGGFKYTVCCCVSFWLLVLL